MSIDLPYVKEILILVLNGIPTTLRLTVIPLLISLPLAFLFAVIRQRNVRILSRLVQVYISFIRGTPLVVQILVIYSLVAEPVECPCAKRGPGIGYIRH